MEFIVRSLPYENLNVIAIGGILERKTNSLVNPQRMEVLNAYNINKAFMATTGISLSNGVTNASPIETDLKQTIVRRSQNVFLLADHDKFDKYGLMTYCELKDIDYLITNKTPDKEYQVFTKENQIELVVVENRLI
jgi:DeoR family myo-inositol catabolism operon transcriptional repressor